jgi:hypothetical protein
VNYAIETGMLTPGEAEVFIQAARGASLFEPLSGGWAQRTGLDCWTTCAQVDHMMHALSNCRHHSGSNGCISVIVVNTLPVTLNMIGEYKKSERGLYGDEVSQPMDDLGRLTRGLPGCVEGHPTFGIWQARDGGMFRGTKFALAFAADPVGFPCGMSLAVDVSYKQKDPLIRIEATADYKQVLPKHPTKDPKFGLKTHAEWTGPAAGAPTTIRFDANLMIWPWIFGSGTDGKKDNFVVTAAITHTVHAVDLEKPKP